MLWFHFEYFSDISRICQPTATSGATDLLRAISLDQTIVHDAIHDVESFGWSILCIVYRRALTELGPPPRHDETSLRYCLVREYALLFVASSISELVYQRGMAFSILGGKDETRPIFKDWPEYDGI